jgi:hypothetical protein
MQVNYATGNCNNVFKITEVGICQQPIRGEWTSMIATIVQLWRDRRENGRSEPTVIGADEEGGTLMWDLGLPVDDLRVLARYDEDAADLLLRRMDIFGLDPEQVRGQDRTLSRDMRRFCTMCNSKSECACHLAMEAGDPTWGVGRTAVQTTRR